MKVKLSQIFYSQAVLSKILQCPMPVKTGYAVSKLARKIDDEHVHIEKQRIELIKKLGEEDEKTKEMKVKPENVSKFTQDFAEFLNDEVDLDIQKFPIDSLPDDLKLTPQEIAMIDFMFEN